MQHAVYTAAVSLFAFKISLNEVLGGYKEEGAHYHSLRSIL